MDAAPATAAGEVQARPRIPADTAGSGTAGADTAGGGRMTLWQRIVIANRPGAAEDSIEFRVASAGAVIIAVAACASLGELSWFAALLAIAGTVVGNILSYRTRRHPWVVVKPTLAVCVIAGFVWFITTASRVATPGDISTVEGPLAVLFAWVLATHAFDVPARRDVAYSIAGSAALMAVAASQAVDLSLAPYVIGWSACSLWGLVAMWRSMSGTRGVPWRTLGVVAVVVVVLAIALVGVLPAPHVSSSLVYPSSSANDQPVTSANNLNDGGTAPSLPAHAASPSGPTRVGGFLGFAKSLDTGIRGDLGDEVLMRVRAAVPSYWVGEVFDHWDGVDWTQSPDPNIGGGVKTLASGSPFTIPLSDDQVAASADSTPDIQTFYLAQDGPNLIFHADNVNRVYLPSPRLLLTANGTIVSPATMGKGTVYTVVSDTNRADAAQLRAATAPPEVGLEAQQLLSPDLTRRYTQLPAADPRVTALAHAIVHGANTPTVLDDHAYNATVAIEAWIADHTRYSTDIPPLAPGQNSVDEFLFGNRVGYCEQISTATVVLLRTLGIPAREATGYVPGSFNPITDLYDVEAKDAHAWVQVWFPGYGWQNFDPTADVPLANPSPGSVIAHDIGDALAKVPWLPVGIVVGIVAVVVAVRRQRARRPPTWAHRVAAELERAGARAGLHRHDTESLSSYAARLSAVVPADGARLAALSSLVERAAYGGVEPSAAEIADAVAFARGLRGRVPKARGGGPGRRRPPQAFDTSMASSKEAPVASSGR